MDNNEFPDSHHFAFPNTGKYNNAFVANNLAFEVSTIFDDQPQPDSYGQNLAISTALGFGHTDSGGAQYPPETEPWQNAGMPCGIVPPSQGPFSAETGPVPPGQARQQVGITLGYGPNLLAPKPSIFPGQTGQPYASSAPLTHRRRVSFSSSHHSAYTYPEQLSPYQTQHPQMAVASGSGVPTGLEPQNFETSRNLRETGTPYGNFSGISYGPNSAPTPGFGNENMPTNTYAAHMTGNSQEADLTGIDDSRFLRGATAMDAPAPDMCLVDLEPSVQGPSLEDDALARMVRQQGSPHAPPFQASAQHLSVHATADLVAGYQESQYSGYAHTVSMGPPSLTQLTPASYAVTDPGAPQKPVVIAPWPDGQSQSCHSSAAVEHSGSRKRPPSPGTVAGDRNSNMGSKRAKKGRVCSMCYILHKSHCISGGCDECQKAAKYCADSQFARNNIFLKVLSEEAKETFEKIRSFYPGILPDDALKYLSNRDVNRKEAMKLISEFKKNTAIYDCFIENEAAPQHCIFRNLFQVLVICQGRKALNGSPGYDFNHSDWNVILAASMQQALDYFQKNFDKNTMSKDKEKKKKMTEEEKDNEARHWKNTVVFLAISLECVLFFKPWFGKEHLAKTEDERNASTITMYLDISYNLANHLLHWARKAFPDGQLNKHLKIHTLDKHSLDLDREHIIIHDDFWDDLRELYRCPGKGTAARPASRPEAGPGLSSCSFPSAAPVALEPNAHGATKPKKPKPPPFNAEDDNKDAKTTLDAWISTKDQESSLAELIERLDLNGGSGGHDSKSGSGSGMVPSGSTGASFSRSLHSLEADEEFDNPTGPDLGALVARERFSLLQYSNSPEHGVGGEDTSAASAATSFQISEAGPSLRRRDRMRSIKRKAIQGVFQGFSRITRS